MKTRHIASLFGVFAVVGVSSASASGATPLPPVYYYQDGVSCKPVNGQANQAGYGEPGIGNFSSTAAMGIFCSPDIAFPVDTGNPVVTSLGVQVIDNSSTSPFSCYPYASSLDSGTYWGQNKFTCSTVNGCTTSTAATSSFTGTAWIGWQAPFGTPDWIQLGTYSVGVACSIPASTSYASWVHKISLAGEET